MGNSVLKTGGQGMSTGATNSLGLNSGQSSDNVMQQFMDFKKGFQGDPKQAVMKMMSNGQINNAQLQQAMQMVKQFQGMLK